MWSKRCTLYTVYNLLCTNESLQLKMCIYHCTGMPVLTDKQTWVTFGLLLHITVDQNA